MSGWYVTASDLLEYTFCPRFIYFECVARIPERQEKRLKVQIGREVHHQRSSRNRKYLRKRVGAVAKTIQAYLVSERLGAAGAVDEVLELSDGSLAPLDYKFAEWKGRVWRTHLMQLGFYALLIEEAYAKPVSKGFVVYVRSNNRVEEVAIDSPLREEVESAIREIRKIVQLGWFPKPTRHRRACADCCYRTVCPGAKAI